MSDDRDPLLRVAGGLLAAAASATAAAIVGYRWNAAHIWPSCLLAAASGFWTVIFWTRSRRGRQREEASDR